MLENIREAVSDLTNGLTYGDLHHCIGTYENFNMYIQSRITNQEISAMEIVQFHTDI